MRAAVRAPATYASHSVLEACKKAAETAYCRGELYICAEQQVTSEESDREMDDAAGESDECTKLLSTEIMELNDAGVVGDVGIVEMQHMMDVERTLPVQEATTEGTALAQAVELGLEQFEAFRNVEDEVVGADTDEDDTDTVAPVEKSPKKPSLTRYNDALVALSEELISVMSEPELIRSELPSSLKSLVLEELRRVRKMQRQSLKQSRIDSYCTR